MDFPSDEDIVSDVVSVDVTASDDSGVEVVEFFVDNSLIGSDASSPYSLSWDSTSFSDGSHEISAQATDSAGNVGEESTEVSL